MARRAIQEDVRKIFSKYTRNFVQRLKKDDALKMLETEFGLSETEATTMFRLFDKDQNGELSLWEFQQFYTTVGSNAHNIIETFHKIEKKDDSGTIDMELAWDTLKSLDIDDGKHLEDKDIEMLLKTTAGSDKAIDLPKFINLMCRIKNYKVQPAS